MVGFGDEWKWESRLRFEKIRPSQISSSFGDNTQERTKMLHPEITPLKTNMTMENPPFEDVFPIEHGDVPLLD